VNADPPHPKLVELGDLLAGAWRVHGPGIDGRAEYQRKDAGRLLVAYVDFRVRNSRIRVIQHIAHHPDRDALLARYMDTVGDEAVYEWELDGRNLRVSRCDGDADTSFRATLNEANSAYRGTWHHPDGASLDPVEEIVYTRIDDDSRSGDESVLP
jgi:hypothetical protein